MLSVTCDPLTILGAIALGSVALVFILGFAYAWRDEHRRDEVAGTRIQIQVDGLVVADASLATINSFLAFNGGDGETWFDETLWVYRDSTRVAIKVIA